MHCVGRRVRPIAARHAGGRGVLLGACLWLQALGCTPIKTPHAAPDTNGRDAATQLPPSMTPGAMDAGDGASPEAGVKPSGGNASGTGPAASAGDGSPSETGGSEPQGGNTAASGGSAGDAAGGGGNAGAPGEEPPANRTPLDPNQTAFASETSDAQTLNLLADWSKLPVLASGRFQQQSSHDRGKNSASEATLFPAVAHGNRDMDNFICKSADADLGAGTVLAYQFDAAKCPEAYLHGVLLARFEGSGRMNRFWMTLNSLFTPGGTLGAEMLRIYVDDNPRALIQVPLAQLLTGAAGEIFTMPFGATSPSFIAWHYPIVFSSKLAIVLDHLNSDYWYQADAVLDAQAQHRVAPRQRLSQRDAAHSLLVSGSPLPAAASSLHAEQLTLAAGDQRAVPLSGPATIEELRLRVPKDKLATLAGVRISASWDGAAQPAIDLPLLDLLASSHALVANDSLALAASLDGVTQVIALRLPMPFQTSAAWTITNGSGAGVDFKLEWFGEKSVPSAAFGHLTVQDSDVALPASQVEQSVAQASGRGRFVGVCADLGGHPDQALGSIMGNLDLLQGDFRATVDGQRAIDSTGTEDYADSAFYFRDSPQSSPFAQNWGRIDDASAQPPGQVSFCRWQVLGNEADFQQDFNLLHEIAPFDPSIVERHHSVAFLYLL